jgi:hypothetical protein
MSMKGLTDMKRLIMTALAMGLLAAPAGATAKPTNTDRTNAAQECRAERGSTAATREAFRVKYGTNANKSNAFGKCVSRRARDEAAERVAAKTNASQECKAQEAADQAAFSAKYGKNHNANNAHGKCVSQKAKAKKAAADARDAERIAARKSAAKDCATERSADRAAFKQKYGTNANKSNAFGKCVSATAKAKL